MRTLVPITLTFGLALALVPALASPSKPHPRVIPASLFQAIRNDDIGAIKLALRSGVSPNAIDMHGDHALNAAVTEERLLAAQVLINAGAQVDLIGADGLTPLMKAAEADDSAMVEMLLLHKASVRALTKRRETPLLFACRSGNATSIDALCNAGANAEAADSTGETPLMAAALAQAQTPSGAIITKLLNQGAQPNDREMHGETPLMYAALADSPEAIKLLLAAGAAPAQRDVDGRSALLYAAQATPDSVIGWIPQIKPSSSHRRERVETTLAILFALTVDSNERNEALTLAALAGNSDAVRQLIALGASPTGASPRMLMDLVLTPPAARAQVATWPRGVTPLMAAAASGSRETIDIILRSKPEIDAKDHTGRTALMYAARAGALTSVNLLIHLGADVNAADNTATTPLMLAATDGKTAAAKISGQLPDDATEEAYESIDKQVLETLVAAGARKGLKDLAGNTAADLASKAGHMHELDVLR